MRSLLKHAGMLALAVGVSIPIALAVGGPRYKNFIGPPCSITVDSAPSPVASEDSISATASCISTEIEHLHKFEAVRVTVSIPASAPTICHNKKKQVAGKNLATAVGSSSTDLTPDQTRELIVPPIVAQVTVLAPPPRAAGCPNPSYTVTLGPVTFGPGTYTVEQPIGTVIPQLTLTF